MRGLGALLARGSRAALPFALGGAAGAGTYAATGSAEESAVAGILAGTLGTRSTIHGLRGGDAGAASRALDKGLSGSPHWQAKGTGFQAEPFDPLTQTRRRIDVNPADPASVAAGRTKLHAISAQVAQDTLLKDVIARKGGLAALVGGGSLLMNLGKATNNIEAVTGEARKQAPQTLDNLKGITSAIRAMAGDVQAEGLPATLTTTLKDMGAIGSGFGEIGKSQNRMASVLEKAAPWAAGGAIASVGAAGLLAYFLNKRKKQNARQPARH